jgi:hypothetical protein
MDPGDLGGSMGGEPYIVTVIFNEGNGVTNVATSIKYASKADRDGDVDRYDGWNGNELPAAR